MANLPTLTLSPAWDITTQTAITYDEAPLGDGYVSRVNRTISIARAWSVRRVGLTTDQKDALMAELSLYAGVDAFLWSPHEQLPKAAYFCDAWSEIPLGPNAWEIQATFKEDIVGAQADFSDLIDIVKIDTWLAGTLSWLQTYTRNTLPLAANSNYVTVNAFHNVLGRGGYFPGSAGTTEGQAALGRACMEAFNITGDTAWRDYAIALGNALINFYYSSPVPSAGTENNTIWAPHWLINVKEAFVSRGPQSTVDPLNYGDFGRIITFTNGVGTIPGGSPANGNLLAVVNKVYSVNGTLLWKNVNSPLTAGTEYAVNYFVSNFQLKGQNYRIFADTESSGGTPPTITTETAGTIVLATNYSGPARLIYSTYSGPTIAINALFEPYPMWRPLLLGEAQAAFDVFPWSWQFYTYLHQATGDAKWARAAAATRYTGIVTAEVENLSFYYQISDDTTNLYTYPGTQSILINNVNGYTDSRQVGGDKDGWLRLDINAAPPLQLNPDGSLTLGPDGKPLGPFPSAEVQNFAIVTGVLNTTTIIANAAHSAGGIVEVGLSIDDDPFTFDQIYKQFWKLNNAGAATARTFSAGELILWSGDYLTWFYQIAESPIYTYSGGSGSVSTTSSFETFTYNGTTAPWLVGVITMNGNGGFAGAGLVFDNLGAFVNAPPRIWIRHTGGEIHYKVIDGNGNSFYYDIVSTGASYISVQPTWAQMYRIGHSDNPNVTDKLQSIEFVAKGNGSSTTYIWFASPGDGPQQLDVPIFTYKAVITTRQRSAHTLWVGNFQPIGNTLDELLYNPGVVPFTVNLLNGAISDWRGVPYAGYQSPLMWQFWGYPDRQLQVEQFLLDAQAAYSNKNPSQRFGPFAPVFSWSYWDNGDFLANGLNDFGWSGPDPNTAWAPYSLRALESTAHTWLNDRNNIRLQQIVMQFLRYLDDDYLFRNAISPITDFPETLGGQANYNEPHAAALIGRAALYANLAGGSSVTTFRILKLCYDYIETQYVGTGTMAGSFSAGQPTYTESSIEYREYFVFWHGEIIEFLALLKKYKNDLTFPGPDTFLL